MPARSRWWPEPRLGAPVKLFSLQSNDLLLDVLPDGRFVVLRRAPLSVCQRAA